MKLPGREVQLKMAPVERLRELAEKAKGNGTARRAAVLALFYPSETGATRLMLILRKTYKGVHSAQVGFPGGKMESEDRTMVDTALRETEEEIGVERSQIEVLCELSEVYIPPSNFIVNSFVGKVAFTPDFVPEEKEVEKLIEVDLDVFLNDDCITTDVLTTSYATRLEVPAYRLDDHIVWGATAMILSEMREMLLEIL